MADGSTPGDANGAGRCPVSRRTFLAGLGAAGAAAAVPGTSLAADATGAPDTEAGADYTYLYRSVPRDERIPTAITTADADTVEALRGTGTDFRAATGEVTGAYAELTRAEAVEVFQTEGVEALRFAPGANPFWQLDDYPGRVFPDSAEAMDYVAFEEAVAGLEHLAERNPDRLSVRTVGQSPGHTDVTDGDPERYGVRLVELTNDVTDEAAFAEKTKVLNSIGIHGDERAGAEAGVRFVENVLRGEEPAVEERLDDVALLFVLPNPDGWVSRSRLTDVDGASSTFRRVNASGVDPNRQYPTVGWIDPNHNPADPDGTNLVDDGAGIDDDVDERYTDRVPDALGVVEALRGYDDVVFAADFHGMFGSENMVEGLLMNDQYGVAEQARLDDLNEALDRRLNDAIGGLLDENRDALERGADNRAPRTRGIPRTPYEYGTILDTIGYTTTGGFGSWLADAVEQGGVAASGISFEMALDNRNGGRMAFIPGLNEVHVAAYQACMRELAVAATRDVDGGVRSNGRDVAVVGTDDLTRSSADVAADPNTTVVRDETQVAVDSAGTSVSLTMPTGRSRVHVGVEPDAGVEADVILTDPGGGLRERGSTVGGGLQGGTALTVADAEAGDWAVHLRADRPAETTVRVAVVDADGPPDPEPALGYEQREYEVTPLNYFDDYDAALVDGSAREESVAAVRDGALVEGGRPAVESCVVIHDDGAGDRGYVSALEEYVEAGGRLVLTDAGLELLGDLSAGGAGSIGAGDVTATTANAGSLDRKRGGALLDGVRDIEAEVWKATPLGYRTRGEAPVRTVDSRAFESAGGTVAATSDGDVILGELDGVAVVGSLLPPASQENLHPFGLYDYALSSMGQQLLVNALGHDQPGDRGGERR